MSMSEQRVPKLLVAAEEELLSLQEKNADRKRAIALTHLQTAILWMNKQYVDELLKLNESLVGG
jgi:hypothetical protein